MIENVIIFGADMSLSVHKEKKNKEILILGGGLTQGLDDNWLTAEAKCPINFKQSRKRMEATVSYLLMPQKYISSKHKTLK